MNKYKCLSRYYQYPQTLVLTRSKPAMIFTKSNPPSYYYVYAYIRNKSSKISDAGTPYYIGKGKSKRAWVKNHRVKVPNDSEYIIILESNLTEIGALALERWLIRWYGRIDIGTGILRNMSDGGEGSENRINFKHTEHTKKLISDKNKELVKAGTHIFQDLDFLKALPDKMRITALKRVENGTHNFQDSELAKERASKRINAGTHNFIVNHPTNKTITCPHCNKIGPGPQMKQWHFDKCKFKNL